MNGFENLKSIQHSIFSDIRCEHVMVQLGFLFVLGKKLQYWGRSCLSRSCFLSKEHEGNGDVFPT